MKKKTNRFLWLSFVGILALCVGVFTWMTRFMLRESDRTINEVGGIYMEEMNRQMQLHFTSIIDMQLSQVEGIVWRTPPEDFKKYDRELMDELTIGAQARDFTYLALYSTEGTADVIYGEDVSIVNNDPFLEALNRDEKKVVVGETDSGEKLLLLGVSVGYPTDVGYPMSDGSHCTALVAGLPISYVNDSMSLKVDESLIFSHIIRKDGSFVLRNADVTGSNYYDWLLQRCQFENQEPEQVVADMKAAFSRGEEFSTSFSVNEERRYVYCSPLPSSEWYLVTVMPHGTLDEAVEGLGNQRVFTALGSCAVIVLALLVIFYIYFRMTRQQLAAVEKAQQEAELASRAKSEFLSNMSHDIRTPMNAIVGMTAIASANMNKPEQVKDCLKKITLSSRHLLGLINDVLDMSKIESGKLSLNMNVLSLRETMESIVCIIQPQVKAQKQVLDVFIRHIQTEQVYCDGVRLNQVLFNLLSNALKFTPEGGSISVTMAQEDSPKGEEYVRTHFWVKDTGMGMSQEFQKKIFDSFVREDSSRVRKIEGTGLGMTITKYIVDEMQGEIELQSELNKGTEFHVTLDLKRAHTKEEDMLLPQWEMLVVDDDEELCLSAVDSLKEIGVEAEWATDGATAIRMAEMRHRQKKDYHIVLLDWKMPGIDGVETARELRRHVGDDIPILLISAYDWSEIEEEARAAGITGFISKPLFKSTLYSGLSRFAASKNKDVELPEEKINDFTGRRLLLAEDNDLNWEIANELLSSFGFSLDWAENGRLCVEKYQASQPGYYDAVLMDLRMPLMNGYEAAEAIRKSGRKDADIPIIAMTADAFSEDIQKCLACGMNAHVAKPLDMREVLRQLQRFMR
ncbi:MAG: response regulator [Hydrogeniiclostridium sp.]